MAKSKRLGELLVDWGVISQKEVQKALDHGKAKALRIGEALIDLKLAQDSQVYKALAAQNNMEYVDLDSTSIPPNAANLIPSRPDAQVPDPASGHGGQPAAGGGARPAGLGNAGHPASSPRQDDQAGAGAARAGSRA